MRARGLSWVGVKTPAYAPMRRFFAEVVGLSVDYESEDFVVFRLPNGDKLEVFGPAADHPPEQFARNEVVASILVEDIDDATAELRDAGVELLGRRESDGAGYAWQHFRLPDGKVFELVCDPSHP